MATLAKKACPGKKLLACNCCLVYNENTMEQKYLPQADPEIAALLEKESKRQEETLMMIPSENHSSLAVKEVVGSVLQDKYCEGYPFKRYYQGQENFDQIETICQERVKKMFQVPYCNVQALSGAPANSAVYFALLEPGDKIMGLRLDQGGHISHGLKVNFSGRFFDPFFYHLNEQGLIDYDALEEMALKERPKMIIAGVTSFPLALDFKRFAEIADKVGAWLLADVSHVAGLILGKVYPDPVPYCHLITTTTHKTLRGPRGALIMATNKGLEKDPELGERIDKAVFPGLQGGPHMNNIAGIAIALKEAESPRFKEYTRQVVKNAKTLAVALKAKGVKLCSGGTESHLLLIDLRTFGLLGNTAAEALERAGIVLNRNGIPFDPNPPFYPSGIRLGTPAITSRGMKEKEMELIADFIFEALEKTAQTKKELGLCQEDEKKKAKREEIIQKTAALSEIKQKVKGLCSLFPLKEAY